MSLGGGFLKDLGGRSFSRRLNGERNEGAAAAEARRTGGAAAAAEDDDTSRADNERFAANGGRMVLPFAADGGFKVERRTNGGPFAGGRRF
ncbi:DNA protecting protein DprA [Sesbania bispinosa]|nr:DNA protecting protein DprA [Sesbania bispinosa]